MAGRNLRFLEEMGLGPIWRLRSAVSAEVPDSGEAEADRTLDAADALPDAATGSVTGPRVHTSRAANAADPASGTMSGARPGGNPELSGRPAARGPSAPPSVETLQAWSVLRETVANCQGCGLCRQRKQAVLGVGDLQPDLLVIGEGPGAEEDQRGEPFVGQAGKLLDAMLASIGLARDSKVYIANAVKCRPPGNRTPEPVEMAACRPYLEQQIDLLKPRLILLLGRAAAHTVLNDDRALAALRSKPFEYRDIPVLVTYHPAYLLRNLPDKAKAWEDLCRVRVGLENSSAEALHR